MRDNLRLLKLTLIDISAATTSTERSASLAAVLLQLAARSGADVLPHEGRWPPVALPPGLLLETLWTIAARLEAFGSVQVGLLHQQPDFVELGVCATGEGDPTVLALADARWLRGLDYLLARYGARIRERADERGHTCIAVRLRTARVAEIDGQTEPGAA